MTIWEAKTVERLHENAYIGGFHVGETVMPISSEALKKERSETIPKGSRCQMVPKRSAPLQEGDDIVRSSWKRGAALVKLTSKMYISEEGCWEWMGGETQGYGTLKLREFYGEYKILCHRLSFVIFSNSLIPVKMNVCHSCDNPKCFNPEHLFLGTQKENMEDCSKKDRTMYGSRNGNSKFSKSEILQVQELLASGIKGKQVSELTGISRSHVSRIKNGYTWIRTTQVGANVLGGNSKYSLKQLENVVKMLHLNKLKPMEISKLTDVNVDTVKDIKRGKSFQYLLKAVQK